jgi:Domain of unknown function (DUF5666)
MRSLTNRLAVIAVTALLTGVGSCGGGDSHHSTEPPAPAPTTGIVSAGVITGFGSVYVNGLRYDTSSAEVTMNDAPAVQSQLRIGMYVEVKGHSHDGMAHDADIIRYHNVLEGPVSSIDRIAGSFVAMGQTVLVTADTALGDEIQPASIEGLKVGDVVEVSGIVPLTGAIEATRVDIKPDGGPFDVTGYVSNVAAGVNRFNINALVIDYSGANMTDFPSGDPANGDLVLVKGSTFYPDGTFAAIHVELRSDDRLTPAAGDLVELEGLIADFVSTTQFKVAGVPVTTTPATTYEHGTAANLADGVVVKVMGSTNATDVVVAAKVAFMQVSTIRVVAQVTAVNVAKPSVTLLGLDVAADGTTQYEDTSTLHLRDFGIDDLAVGDWVDLRAYEEPEGSNALIATRVMRINAAESVRLRGPFREPARPDFHIVSVLVGTTDATRFLLEGDIHLTQAEFFAQATDKYVEAWGSWNGARLNASRVEIKVDED